MPVRIDFEWDYLGQMVGIRGWHVYVAEASDVKGVRVGCCVAPEPRKVAVILEEGSWFLRAVPVGSEDQEAGDWWNCPTLPVFAHGRTQTPDAPARVAAAFSDPSLSVRVGIQPVNMENVPGTVEVIALPHGGHASQGKLLGAFPIERADLIDRDPTRALSALIPCEGSGAGGSRIVSVRVLSDTGQPGASVETTIAKPAAPDHHAIAIASITRSSGAAVAFPASSTSVGYEYGAGYGLRLKTLPTFDAMTTALFDSLERIAPFVTNATILTSEVDLGAELTFVLEISDEIERAARYGAFEIEMMSAMGSSGVLSPTDDPVTRRTVEDPSWIGRECFMDGTPRRPIRPENARWFYVATLIPGADALATVPANWVEYVPGAVVRGRYIVIGLLPREPCGMHQIVTGDVSVIARVARKTTVGAGTPESAVLGVPGDRFVRTDGPPYLYVKVTGLGNTGWQGA